MTNKTNPTRPQTLTGYDAIEYARAEGLPLNKYADPTEDAREGLTVEEAEDIAAEDPSLIWVAAQEQRTYAAVVDDVIDALHRGTETTAMAWWRGRGEIGSLVVLDLGEGEDPTTGDSVTVDEDGVAELAEPEDRDTLNDAQLYWDDQGGLAGWWLRYHDARGVETGEGIDGAQDASTEELASAVEEALALTPSDRGTIRVHRGEEVRGEIRIADGKAKVVSW